MMKMILRVLTFLALLVFLVSCADEVWEKDRTETLNDEWNTSSVSDSEILSLYNQAPLEIVFEDSDDGSLFEDGRRVYFKYRQVGKNRYSASLNPDELDPEEIFIEVVQTDDDYYRVKLMGSRIWVTYRKR